MSIYVQGRMVMSSPMWILKRMEYHSPVEQLIDRCSSWLSAETISDSLPERLNIFAFLPNEVRKNSFISMSSVDQKMAMEKTGPYWHAYFTAFPDIRFVGATQRRAHGVVTKDPEIHTPQDLVGKRIAVIPRPSSLRALQEIVLFKSWGIYDDVEIKEYLPQDMEPALENGEIDAMFLPVVSIVNGEARGRYIDLERDDLWWISLSVSDVSAAVEDTPILAERVTITPPNGATNGDREVGLITRDSAYFTFAVTPDDVVYDFIQAMRFACPPGEEECEGLSMDTMLRWPELTQSLVHPGALKYYREQGVQFD
ncbi:MAG: ABC transporter substrate-binding protein [Acidobacteria bacterium]|nr:ABC transporter substrate-binding protein [Acidobacteriota bacterium]